MKKVLMGTEAAAVAAKLARIQVVSAYPITPQTVVVENLSDMIGKGELDARYMTVESEHSAMASCIGASAAGARAFTASSSQGLALMHEVLHYAAGGRFPIVMVNANRALAPPWNLYCDHTDSLAQRDTGWIQYYCADVQDVLDAVLIAFRVAEQVLLPVMINMDAFYLTHTSEVLDVPDQIAVDEFLPPFRPDHKLDVNHPRTFGNVCGADLYTSIKYQRQRDMLTVESLWKRSAEEFEIKFGRMHPAVDAYRHEDAEVLIVGIGSVAGAMHLAADRLREDGLAVGSLRLAMVRPFPLTGFLEATATVKHMVVIDRDVSFGAEGIIAQEIKAALAEHRRPIQTDGFIAGIGGKDLTSEKIIGFVLQAINKEGAAVRAGLSLWAEVLP